MRNNYSLLETGYIPGHPLAFTKNAVGKIQLYDSVFEAVSDAVEDVVDFAGDVIDVAVDVVEDVADTIGNVIETALDDPVKTIATIAALATGQPQLIPYINAADALASGADFDDVLKTAAISYVAQEAGSLAGTEAGAALDSNILGSAVGAATSGATSAALSGGDVDQAIYNALGSYLAKTGINYTINSAGQLIDQYGNVAPDEVYDEIGNLANEEYLAMQDEELTQLAGPTDESITGPTTVDNGDGTFTQTFDDGSTITTDAAGNVVQSTTYDGEVITPGLPSTIPDPYEIDNTGTRDEADILTGTTYDQDPYEVDAEASREEEDYLTGNTPSLTDAAQQYFKNQFINSLTRQIFGGDGGGGTSGGTSSRLPWGMPPSGTPAPIADFGGMLGGASLDETTTPMKDLFAGPSKPAELWDPGIGLSWGPQQKLGGLGFAGKFINKENDEYVNQQAEERDRIIEQAKARGYMTDEERQMLEQADPYFDQSPEIDLTSASPWFNPEYAHGGQVDHNPEFYSEGGASLANRYVKGGGDGTSDSVPAMLASGEFVIPADVVSSLGNGDNDAGAKVLDSFMHTIRDHKRSADSSQLPPDSKGPLSYLQEAQRKVGKKNGRT